MAHIYRVYVEKKEGFNIEAEALLQDLTSNLQIKNLSGVRVLNRYDIEGISEEELSASLDTILSEPPVDRIFQEELTYDSGDHLFGVEYLPGQYDQRADSAAQCIQIITRKEKPVVRNAKLFILQGKISKESLVSIKRYLINPVDSRECELSKPDTLKQDIPEPSDVETLEHFINLDGEALSSLRKELGLAMSPDDLLFVQSHFKNDEKRDPTITELRMLDTYWSDHCRHTTFHSHIDRIEIEAKTSAEPIKRAFCNFLKVQQKLPGKRDISLMNLATMSMKELRSKGKLSDMEVSSEINACSIIRTIVVDGKEEDWLILFKNETHNHPTEIEPFGGAATCLGGAIRDPLSGRAYVYQAMRVSGCADPRQPIWDTLAGKLPQRKITTEAAHGYSSYGNQIGLATGIVREIYDPGYVAKRMEVGAVVGAVKRTDIIREEPVPGDIILLIGGRTGRDGIGGATGSSKEHTEESVTSAGAEVQKGNPPEERKLQRFFRNPEVTRMIKKSNDFGAGGVSVAVGELTRGIDINLDSIKKKYEGLDGTELALSESQERMAVVISPDNVDRLSKFARLENLETTRIATVTDGDRLRMVWRGKTIVDISRFFLDTNGVRQTAQVFVSAPSESKNPFRKSPPVREDEPAASWTANLGQLNVASQAGLIERFDSSIGAGTVLMPFGGKHQLTPSEVMVAKIPTLNGKTDDGTAMAFGFNPRFFRWSPFHGAVYSVVESLSKLVACGAKWRDARFTLQEYFEKLLDDEVRWGKPFAALLGAYHCLSELELAAIGGKDSMSGSFENLHVPPTLIAFAINTIKVDRTLSGEFKSAGNPVVQIILQRDEFDLPKFAGLKEQYDSIQRLIGDGDVLSAQPVTEGGVAAAISKMALGNRIGFHFRDGIEYDDLFRPEIGSILLELKPDLDIPSLLANIPHRILGSTIETGLIRVKGMQIQLDELQSCWQNTLSGVFPTIPVKKPWLIETPLFTERRVSPGMHKPAKPLVFIPVFPGTNCEYDTQQAIELAGAKTETLVFRNLKAQDIIDSLDAVQAAIQRAQIVVLPGGFSAGDEPDGSGKFIAAVFRNEKVRDALMDLLKQRDGLMLGICNGFQALIKLGLLPWGKILPMESNAPTLTFNSIGRHISQMVHTRVVSTLSPWFSHSRPGEIHTIPVSHGEGRFVASRRQVEQLIKRGQVATQYVNPDGLPGIEAGINPNGSVNAIEGISSPDGRILGKMGHGERISEHVARNIPGNKFQKLFESGVEYFN